MDLIFGYFAGLLTLLNPCVLPILPIVLTNALRAGPWGPWVMAAGMSLVFVTLGVGVSAFGYAIGLTQGRVVQASAILMTGFGLMLLLPRLGSGFQTATGRIAGLADRRLDRTDGGTPTGQFLTGALLGGVWSPCIGPTLGGAIGLASQGQNLGGAAAIMTAFAAGVSTLIIGLSRLTRGAMMRNRARMASLARLAKPLLGVVFVATGVAILSGWHHAIEAWAVNAIPLWMQDLSVRF